MDTENLIENALSTYAEAAPRPGLEQRVFTRIRVAQTRRHRTSCFAAISVGLAAAVLLVLTSPEAPPILSARMSAPSVNPPNGLIKPNMTLRRRVPKKPVPVTSEERVLAAWVKSAPEQLQLALQDVSPQPIKPIEITPVEIQPLSGFDPH